MRVVCFLVALLSFQCCLAQWFKSTSAFTTQQGLSNNTVTCFQKDSAGFLWIGTHEGLNRYDGTEFINVLSNSKNNLPSNNINKMCFVNESIMAIGTDGGLCLLNTKTLTGKKIELPFDSNFTATGYYISDILYKTNTKELWVCTWHGVFVLSAEGKLLRKLMGQPADMNKGFLARYLLKDNQDRVYIFSQQRKGFYYPDFQTAGLTAAEKINPDFSLNEMLQNNFSLMGAQMFDHEMIAVFSKVTPKGSEDYLAYINIKNGRHFLDRILITVMGEKRLSSAFPLDDSTFLLNSYFGEPMLYNSNLHEVKMAADHPLWFTSWPDGYGASMYKDKTNIWIGTAKGMLQSSIKTNFFKTNPVLINQLKDDKGLVSYNYGLFKNDKLWIASMGTGLFGVDTAQHIIRRLFDANTPATYRKKIVSTEVLDAGKSLWLFSMYGPTAINPVTHQISVVEGVGKDSSFDDYASYPFKDSKGNIWTTLPEGISSFNTAGNTFTNYITKYRGGPFPLLKAGVKTEDKQGNIWMARQDTLAKFDPHTGNFSIALVKKDGRILRPITSLASDGGDILYVSVAGSLGMFHIATGSVELFTKQTGIISTAINDIVSDHDGNAWIATESGLIYYNKERKKFSSFTQADGLPDDNVISINFADAEKKSLFLGFAKTYCLFQPQNFLLDKNIPLNAVTGVEVDGQEIAITDQPKLTYKQNSISFTYSGINYNQGQQNNYACMLEGFDQEWKYTGTERKINYINLPTGSYTFKVKSANHQGEWNEEPAKFYFEILPPFWQTVWFRLLLSCTILFAIYYFIKRREAAFRKENHVKLQMSELRMQALQAQMNPHFIFNSLNSIQNYILSNNTLDAASYLSRFAKLMRRILDQSKHNFLPLGEVMETLKLYVGIEAFRFNNEFTYSFDIAQNDELLEAQIPPMLLQPFVENAILHGLMPKDGEKILTISCQLLDNSVEIIIDDNGIGRTQHQAKAGHTSQGEKLTAGMLESLQQLQNNKATIEIIDKVENEMPSGTTIKLMLPLN